MASNQVISTMFDNNSFIRMVRIVLTWIETKILGSPLVIIDLIPGCNGYYLSIIYCHVDQNCVGLWLCSSNMSQLHCVLSRVYGLFESWRYGSTLYCLVVISLVIASMDLQCIGQQPCSNHFVSSMGMPSSGIIYICILSMFCWQLLSNFQVNTLTIISIKYFSHQHFFDLIHQGASITPQKSSLQKCRT